MSLTISSFKLTLQKVPGWEQGIPATPFYWNGRD